MSRNTGELELEGIVNGSCIPGGGINIGRLSEHSLADRQEMAFSKPSSFLMCSY